jgi:hypothetical protein
VEGGGVEDVEAGALPNENSPWLPLPKPAPESLGPPPNPDPNGNMALNQGVSKSREKMNANAKGNCSRRSSTIQSYTRCDQKSGKKPWQRENEAENIFFYS